MRLAKGKARRPGFEEGSHVAGYRVGRRRRAAPGEIVYDAVTRAGREATLVASYWPRGGHHARARFRRLARARAEVEHPALLPVHEWGEHGGTAYLVTERYPSRTLAGVIRKHRLAPSLALELLWPVAEALDLCHARGLAHRNLTARNILLEGEDAVLDGFGIATVGSEWTWEAVDPRTFRYGSPEAIRGDEPEPATNVYALAGVLVHLLTGKVPYADIPLPPSNAAWTAAMVHLSEPPPRPSDRVPDLGREIDGVIAWGMAKEPERRPSSATALIDAAADALGFDRVPSSTVAAGTAPARPVVQSEPPRSRRVPARGVRLVAIVAAAAVGGVGGALAGPFGESTPRAASETPEMRAVATLGERREELRSDLAAATLPAEQSEAAEELAAAYRDVAARTGSPALADAASDAASSYSALAAAAAEGSEARFTYSSAAVEHAERRVMRAIANLQDNRR